MSTTPATVTESGPDVEAALDETDLVSCQLATSLPRFVRPLLPCVTIRLAGKTKSYIRESVIERLAWFSRIG